MAQISIEVSGNREEFLWLSTEMFQYLRARKVRKNQQWRMCKVASETAGKVGAGIA